MVVTADANRNTEALLGDLGISVYKVREGHASEVMQANDLP